MVPNVHFKTGKQVSPFGTEFVGISIRIGGVFDPTGQKRDYEDIRRILKDNSVLWTEHEEKDSQGKFKSFIIEA